MGMPFACVSSRTIRSYSGISCSVTGLARLVLMAILSEYQYIAKLNPRPMTKPQIRPVTLRVMAPPMSTKSPPRAAMRTQVLTLFTSASPPRKWGSLEPPGGSMVRRRGALRGHPRNLHSAPQGWMMVAGNNPFVEPKEEPQMDDGSTGSPIAAIAIVVGGALAVLS